LIISELKTDVANLQKGTDSLGIELKQVLLQLTTRMSKLDESIKELKEDIKTIKHTCKDNSSNSSRSTPEK
jgi:hypothetical protein